MEESPSKFIIQFIGKKTVKYESPDFAICEAKWLKLLNKMFNHLQFQ